MSFCVWPFRFYWITLINYYYIVTTKKLIFLKWCDTFYNLLLISLITTPTRFLIILLDTEYELKRHLILTRFGTTITIFTRLFFIVEFTSDLTLLYEKQFFIFFILHLYYIKKDKSQKLLIYVDLTSKVENWHIKIITHT